MQKCVIFVGHKDINKPLLMALVLFKTFLNNLKKAQSI